MNVCVNVERRALPLHPDQYVCLLSPVKARLCLQRVRGLMLQRFITGHMKSKHKASPLYNSTAP